MDIVMEITELSDKMYVNLVHWRIKMYTFIELACFCQKL